MKQFHNYHPDTFEYLGSKPMKYSPLDKAPAPPAHSTVQTLPILAANEAAVFDVSNNKWNVIPDFRGIKYYKKSDGTEVMFKLGTAPDSSVQTTLPVAIKLEKTKELKRNEIRNAFFTDTLAPVVVNTVSYHPGIESAYRLDAALRLNEKAGLTDVSFTDINNVAHVLTIAQANAVIIAVGQDYQIKFMKKQQKMVDIKNATDEAAVNLITY